LSQKLNLNLIDRFFENIFKYQTRSDDNLSTGSRVVPCGRKEGQTDVMTLSQCDGIQPVVSS